MKKIDRVVSTCSTVINYASGNPAVLDKGEVVDLEAAEEKAIAMRDGFKASRENLAAQRKDRQEKLAALRAHLAASKAYVASQAALGASSELVQRLGPESSTVKGVLSVAASYRKVLETAGDEAYAKKLLTGLKAAVGDFTETDAKVRGLWTSLKTQEHQDAAELETLANKVRCYRNLVDLRTDRAERMKFRQMLRTGSREYVRHGNAETSAVSGTQHAQTTAPVAKDVTTAAA